MSIESLALVLHHSRAKGTAKLVLVGIANHDGDGGAYPAYSTLARYAGIDRSGVKKHVARLVELGEVKVHVQAGYPDRPEYERTNRYDVLVSCPPECDRTKHHRMRTMVEPTEPPALWITPGVTPHPGVTTDPRPGVTTDPQTIHSTIDTTGGRSVTGSRASAGSTPGCTECSAVDLYECTSRQAKLRAEDRHTYTPKAMASTAVRYCVSCGSVDVGTSVCLDCGSSAIEVRR